MKAYKVELNIHWIMNDESGMLNEWFFTLLCPTLFEG